MAVANLGPIATALIGAGRPADTRAVVVENATLPHQRITHAVLSDLAATAAARGVEPPAVVDHQHVAGSGPFERLQKDIDAASMSNRKRSPGQATAGHNWAQGRRPTAHRDLSADASIRQVGGGQRREALPQLLVIQPRSRYGQRSAATGRRVESFQSDPAGENASMTVAPSGPDPPE